MIEKTHKKEKRFLLLIDAGYIDKVIDNVK